MDNTLVIRKEEGEVKVGLRRNGVWISELIFPLDIHFDTVLVSSIDKILKENRIDRVSPLEIVLEGFEDASSMSSLIARTVVEALKIK